ncbi:unnamed protein product, partial [Didymodactylos carnosus]
KLLIKLDELCEKQMEFDIGLLLKRTTLDIIFNCAFGIESDIQNNITDPYFQRCAQVFKFNLIQMILTFLSTLFPEFNIVWVNIFRYCNFFLLWIRDNIPFMEYLIDVDPNMWLQSKVENVIKKRQQSENKRIDLLQLMLDASSFHESANLSSPSNEVSQSARTLSYSELLMNIYLFMLAGYETSSTALSYLCYVLATHQHEQKILQNEIEHNLTSDFNYENINKLEYLDMFIRETLRMYPIAPFIVNRKCNDDCTINGMQIKHGMNFIIDMFSVHYDPVLWGPTDPNIFYPERFKTKRHPAAWLPFGIGPRNCIGLRFAMMEIKLTLIKILKCYTVLSGEKTLSHFKEHEVFVISPKFGIWIQLQRR